MVVTDGRSDDPDGAWRNAMKLREGGVTMLAVGVGDNIRDDELEGIASNGNVLKATNFGTLNAEFDNLVNLMCNSRLPFLLHILESLFLATPTINM